MAHLPAFSQAHPLALRSTVFKAEVGISDLDRHYYQTHSLTLARHPSETDERMMVRLLAFVLNASETLEFGRGISTDDEPALWDRDLTGSIQSWIEVGQPEERLLKRASGRADQVLVYAYGRALDVWWKQNEAAFAKLDKLRVWRVSPEDCTALTALVERGMSLQCTVQDGHVLVAAENDTVQIEPMLLTGGTLNVESSGLLFGALGFWRCDGGGSGGLAGCTAAPADRRLGTAGLMPHFVSAHRAMLKDLHEGLDRLGDRHDRRPDGSFRTPAPSCSYRAARRPRAAPERIAGMARRQLGASIEVLTRTINERLDAITGVVNQRLDEGFRKNQRDLCQCHGTPCDHRRSPKKKYRRSDDKCDQSARVAGRQKKLAAHFGEVQLEALVRNALPPDAYEFQATLAAGVRADCLLRLPEPTGKVAVDSKFPLENYHRMFDTALPELERNAAQSLFKQDIKRHIDAIAGKYIRGGRNGGWRCHVRAGRSRIRRDSRLPPGSGELCAGQAGLDCVTTQP